MSIMQMLLAGGKSYIAATGGTVTTVGDYKVHTFTSAGTFTITSGSTDQLEYLVVGGGGAGGYNAGGGGGGGGVLHAATTLNPGSYAITVGGGGNGFSFSNGTASTFNGLTANGGFAGGSSNGAGGANGNGFAGSNPWNDGVYWYGGDGGGALGAATQNTRIMGPGLTLGISGSTATYGVGGQGMNDHSFMGSNQRAAATGYGQGGDGGTGGNGGQASYGGNGGPGVVIIRYRYQNGDFQISSGGSQTFSSSGTFVAPANYTSMVVTVEGGTGADGAANTSSTLDHGGYGDPVYGGPGGHGALGGKAVKTFVRGSGGPASGASISVSIVDGTARFSFGSNPTGNVGGNGQDGSPPIVVSAGDNDSPTIYGTGPAGADGQPGTGAGGDTNTTGGSTTSAARVTISWS